MDNTPAQPTTVAPKQSSTLKVVAIVFIVISIVLAGVVTYLAVRNNSLAADTGKNSSSDSRKDTDTTSPPANPRAVIAGTVKLQSGSIPATYVVCALSDTHSPYCTSKFTPVSGDDDGAATYELGVEPGRYVVIGSAVGERSAYANVSAYSDWQKDTETDRCADVSATLPRVVTARTDQTQTDINVGMDDRLFYCRK